MNIEFGRHSNSPDSPTVLVITYPTDAGDDMAVASAQVAAILGYPRILSAGPHWTEADKIQSVWGKA